MKKYDYSKFPNFDPLSSLFVPQPLRTEWKIGEWIERKEYGFCTVIYTTIAMKILQVHKKTLNEKQNVYAFLIKVNVEIDHLGFDHLGIRAWPTPPPLLFDQSPCFFPFAFLGLPRPSTMNVVFECPHKHDHKHHI